MRIRMLVTQRGVELYEKGKEYDFPDDVARRWIARGRAEQVEQKEIEDGNGGVGRIYS